MYIVYTLFFVCPVCSVCLVLRDRESLFATGKPVILLSKLMIDGLTDSSSSGPGRFLI